MYRCLNCGETFDSLNCVLDSDSEYWGRNVHHYTSVCPFCGSDAEMCHGHNHYYARCTNQECLVRTRRYCDVTEAIRAWNRRVKE